MEDVFFPLAVLFILFVMFPATLFHYITIWRKQKSLQPDDERMLEDLWRSARAMERRIESLEAIMDGEPSREAPQAGPQSDIYRKN